ncbi:MAG: hypothetical protein ACREPV_13305 [Lysobacter sp.]
MPTYLELNPWHKRQAALLYHYVSLDYLKGLPLLIDEWIAFTDAALTDRSPLDATGLAHANWQPVNTTAHFSTCAYAAMVEFREGVLKDIANRAFEKYDIAGEYQCARMLQEYAGYPRDMLWATYEQQEAFKERAEKAFKYAQKISFVLARPTTRKDFSFWSDWQRDGHLFPKLPKLRVRTDVVGETGKTPPRTGVYVPQEDPYAALQFAWTGGHGELGETHTLNEIGHAALAAVGRKGLWDDQQGLLEFINKPEYRNLESIDDRSRSKAKLAPSAVSREGFESKPCNWYFVEMVNDEYEDCDGTYAGTGEVAQAQHRVPAGKDCPRSGYWFTPAKQGSRRYFKQGDVFPEIEGSTYGATFWQWSPDQSDPKL